MFNIGILSTSILAILTLFLFVTSLYAKEKPLYELGLAGGRFIVPDYPASDQTTTHTVVIPSFMYRGTVLRSDRRGTRARFFKNEYVDFDLSIGGSLPSSSKDNRARKGMEDLHFMMEAGPRANYTLLFTEKYLIELELPYRFVFSTDTQHTEHRGYRFQPQIDFTRTIYNKFLLGFSFKLNYGTEKLTDYFYEVNGSDVNAQRQRYNAKAGYIGRDASFSIIYRNYPYLFVTGFRLSNYQDSVNESSPLYKTHENQSIFLGFNVFFWQSKSKGQGNNELE